MMSNDTNTTDSQKRPRPRKDRTDDFAVLFAGTVVLLAILKAIPGMSAGEIAQTFIGVTGFAGLYYTQRRNRNAAEQRSQSTQTQLAEIKETAQAGTADAVAEKLSKKIGGELLEDESFVAQLAGKLGPHFKNDCAAVAEAAAKKALELQRKADETVRVKT